MTNGIIFPIILAGDIMGCGILFPRGYSSEMDSDGSPDMSPDMTEEGPEEFMERDYHSSDSEDEEWWRRPYAEKGTKVQVSSNMTYDLSIYLYFVLLCDLMSHGTGSEAFS